jgi:hypothetical protein
MLWQEVLQLIHKCGWVFIGIYDACDCVHAGRYFSERLFLATLPLPTVLPRAF